MPHLPPLQGDGPIRVEPAEDRGVVAVGGARPTLQAARDVLREALEACSPPAV